MTAARPVVNDPSLLSTWSHRAWLTFGCVTITLTVGKSMLMAAAASSCAVKLAMMVAGLAGDVLADLASGVCHWRMNNYGDASTPVCGPQIETFQGHHKLPWMITRRKVANNLHKLARAVAFLSFPFVLLCGDATVLCFAASFGFFIMMSQSSTCERTATRASFPLSSWHCRTREYSCRGRSMGPITVPHTATTTSSSANGILDKNRVFEALEMAMYFLLGVRPRSWSEPGSEWTKRTERRFQRQPTKANTMNRCLLIPNQWWVMTE